MFLMATYLQMIKNFQCNQHGALEQTSERLQEARTYTRLIIMQNKQDADFQNIVGLGALHLAINEFRDYHLKLPLNFYSCCYL